MFVGFHT